MLKPTVGPTPRGMAMRDTLNWKFNFDVSNREEVGAEMNTRYFSSGSEKSQASSVTVLRVDGKLILEAFDPAQRDAGDARGDVLLGLLHKRFEDAFSAHASNMPSEVAAQNAEVIASLFGSKEFLDADRALHPPDDKHKVHEQAIDIQIDGADIYIRKTTTYVAGDRSCLKGLDVNSAGGTRAESFFVGQADSVVTEVVELEMKFSSKFIGSGADGRWTLEAKVTDVAVELSDALEPEAVRERMDRLGVPTTRLGMWFAWLASFFSTRGIQFVVSTPAELEAAKAARQGDRVLLNDLQNFKPAARVSARHRYKDSGAHRFLTHLTAAAKARVLAVRAPEVAPADAGWEAWAPPRLTQRTTAAIVQLRAQPARDAEVQRNAMSVQAAHEKLGDFRASGLRRGGELYDVLQRTHTLRVKNGSVEASKCALGTEYVAAASKPDTSRRIIDARTRLGASLFHACGQTRLGTELPVIKLDEQDVLGGAEGDLPHLRAYARATLALDQYIASAKKEWDTESTTTKLTKLGFDESASDKQERLDVLMTKHYRREAALRDAVNGCAKKLRLSAKWSLGVQRAEVEKRLLDIVDQRLEGVVTDKRTREQVLSVLLHADDAMPVVQGIGAPQFSNMQAVRRTIAIRTRRSDETIPREAVRVEFNVRHDKLGDGVIYLGEKSVEQAALQTATMTIRSRWTVSAEKAELSSLNYDAHLALDQEKLALEQARREREAKKKKPDKPHGIKKESASAPSAGATSDLMAELALRSKHAVEAHQTLMRGDKVRLSDFGGGNSLHDLGTEHLRNASANAATQANARSALENILFERCGTGKPVLLLDQENILAPHQALRLYASALRHLSSPAEPEHHKPYWQGVVNKLAPEVGLSKLPLEMQIAAVKARLFDAVIQAIGHAFPNKRARDQVITAVMHVETATYAVIHARGGPWISAPQAAEEHVVSIATRWTNASVAHDSALITFTQYHGALGKGGTARLGVEVIKEENLETVKVEASAQVRVSAEGFELDYVRFRAALKGNPPKQPQSTSVAASVT
ncbi:hypothetical protein AB870_23940 (plasmid) [Pandoraea faecigallinarum]|uniref:Uncharacterized protein n=1 Tax=Pandoraea faecigallinarum TaxID=656179 RepID=A0A0H3X047_9BURK|nr:hypothetical protein [Pandoraea faecigallinarum]AKM33265.3 hypothetical protein AB870_23940 [Pandoraea faecigallinarum]